MFEKKKKILSWNWSKHPCVIIYFQCKVPGISTLEWSVETESFSSVLWGQVLFGKPFDLSVIEGALKWNNY